MSDNKKIILASASPRRIEIMKKHGYDPVVMPAEIDEYIPPAAGMEETPMFLALKKAQASASQYCAANQEEGIIIAADTIVYKDGEIMGKPVDSEDGMRMLRKLKNDYHYVVTGVALVKTSGNCSRVFAEVTKVFFKDYSDRELEEYLATDEAYDKAGAYAIQGYFSKYIDHIEGDYDNVVGFPFNRIEIELKKLEEQ